MGSWRTSAAYRIAFANFTAFAIGLALLGIVVFAVMHVTFSRQLDATILQQPVGKTLDAVLERIEREQGMATADFVALQLEYPRR